MSTHCRQCCRPFDTSMQPQAFPPKTCGLKRLKAATMLLGRGSPSKLWAGTSLSPESVETQKWHMKKQRQNVRSTKQKLIADGVSDKIELTWTITKQNILVKVINTSEMVFTNQTGRFPVQSSRGNTSLMVYYDIDANYINAEPIRSHADQQMIVAYQKLWEPNTNEAGRSNQIIIYWIMRHQKHLRQQFDKTAIYNWYHLTLTAEIKQLSKYSRATSW